MAEQLARLMRGNCPAVGDDYPEKYLPVDILTRLKANETWTDNAGFQWGWNQLCAEKDSGNSVKIKVAGSYHGQGYHSVKYWLPEKGIYHIEHIG